MSIYDTAYPNRLDIRSRSTMTDELLVWNPLTQQYEHVTPGGDGEPITLPYYLQNDSIQFTGARGVNSTFVNDVDEIQNVILPAHEASLEELDGRVDANSLAVDNLMPRMTAVEGVNTTQGTNITALQTKTANITQTGTTSLTLSHTSASQNKVLINSSGFYFYTGGTTLGYPHVKIDNSSIAIASSTAGSVYLDATRLDNLAKLTSVTTSDFNDKLNLTKGVTFPGGVETTDTSNKKMVVMDNTTKALSYAPIPTGAGIVNGEIKINAPDMLSYTSMAAVNGKYSNVGVNSLTDSTRTRLYPDGVILANSAGNEIKLDYGMLSY